MLRHEAHPPGVVDVVPGTVKSEGLSCRHGDFFSCLQSRGEGSKRRSRRNAVTDEGANAQTYLVAYPCNLSVAFPSLRDLNRVAERRDYLKAF